MDLLTAPYLALFNKSFYEHISRTSLKKGFLYLFFLSITMSLLVVLMINFVLFPQADKFVDWVKKEMPILTLDAQQGLSMNQDSPYTMIHPEMGPVATFDLTKEEVTQEAMGDVSLFVTKKNIYVRQPNQLRVYPLNDLNQKVEKQEPVQIHPNLIDRFYSTSKPIILAVSFFAVLVTFFVWKILVALFFSLIGILFNSMRIEKLSYPAVLNVTVFALTPSILFQMVRLFIPTLAAIPFISVLDIGMTSAYLYFAIKMSEGASASGYRIEPAI